MNSQTLTARDREVLSTIELADQISPSSIARKLRLRVHTVQHTLERLRSRGVFSRGPFIDIHRLGLRWCGVFISLLGDARQLLAAKRFVEGHPAVGWFADLSGSFTIGVAVAVEHPRQVDDFLKDLVNRSKVTIYRKSISFRLLLMDCPRGYLSPRASSKAAHYIEDGVAPAEVDTTDRRILKALVDLPEGSMREIGAHLGMPHTTVDLRLRKLRANKVLLGYSLHLHTEMLGRQLHKLLIHTGGRSSALSLAMQRFALHHPYVSHFVETIGSWDFELNVEVESLSQLQEFESDLRREFPNAIHDVTALGVAKVHTLRRFTVHQSD